MIIKSAQNIVIPKYLNEQFFANALEEGLREVKITVKEISFEWGSNPGDNYCSSIYRVLVTYERQTDQFATETQKQSLIVKTIPITEGTQFLEDVGVFIVEKLVYYDVLPRLEVLGTGNVFGCRCFYAIKEPVQTIVFNDLAVEGYTTASRQDKLDWNHCELLLQQLGKFHASSIDLFKKKPELIKRFGKGMLSPATITQTDTFKHMFGNNLVYLIEYIANCPGFEKIAQKLQSYYERFEEVTINSAKLREDDRIRVLNHGDLWTTNFMYAYKDATAPKKPTNAVFIDFQICFYGSPACDLNFFLNTSVKLDVLMQRRDDLVATYYKAFSDTLQYLRCESIPSFEDLKYELRRRELYGLFALYGFLPIVSLPQEASQGNSIDAMTDESHRRKKLEIVFNNELIQKQIKYALKRLDDLGVLDEF